MQWLSIEKDGYPEKDIRVLTYSKIYAGEKAYRLLDSQFIKMCSEVTHYMYLDPPDFVLTKE